MLEMKEEAMITIISHWTIPSKNGEKETMGKLGLTVSVLDDMLPVHCFGNIY